MDLSWGGLKWSAWDLLGMGSASAHCHNLRRLHEASFARLRFVGADGRQLQGRDLTLFHRGKALPDVDESDDLADCWYCLGPDGRVYAAIPVSFRMAFGWRVDWEVHQVPHSCLPPFCRARLHEAQRPQFD